MKRIALREIDSLNVLTILRWMCRLTFAAAFGMTFAIVVIFARWSLETKKQDQTAEYTVIRLTAENEQLREAVLELNKQLRPVKNSTRNIGGN